MSGETSTRAEDLEAIRSKLAELAAEGRTDELIAMVLELLTRVRDDNTALRNRLHTALRQIYGQSSEKVPSGQLSLMFDQLGDDAPDSARQAASDEEHEVERPRRRPRKRGGRQPLPKDLPRETKHVPVPEPLRTCHQCGVAKAPMGTIHSEVLEFVPAHFKIIDEHREKLACPSCQSEVASADTQKPMDKGRPGPGLLGYIIVSKGQDKQPLYRQSQIYERAGVRLSPSTLGDWFAFGTEILAPLARHARTRVLSSLVVRADDTGIKVLDRSHAKGVKLGHMWGYVGDQGLVVFDYTPTWEAKGPRAFLEGFDGWLQGDGYAGFKAQLERKRDGPLIPEHRRLGCAMHVRRKFEHAADAGDARGAVALAYFRKIYRVERDCKDEGLTPDQRKARRHEQSRPVLDELYDWIRDVHRNVVPGDKLYKATYYALNQEDALRRCFDDGHFEIDNGEVERQLRRVALGRKNYLFAGNDTGAHRLAVAYTLLGSCHMLGVDPLAYLTDVIDKVQSGWPKRRIGELLPDVWHAR